MPDYAASVQAVGLRVTKLSATGAPLVGTTTSYITKAFTRFSWTPEYSEGEEIETVAADGSRCVFYKMPDTLKEVTFELEICAPSPELHEMLGGGSILVVGEGATFTITNKALTTNVATLTTSATHTLLAGDTVIVAGVDAVFNGTYVVTAPITATTFSYARTNANVVSGVATGTALKGGNNGWGSPDIGTVVNPNGVAVEVWSRAIVGGKPASVNPYWRWVLPYIKTRLEGDRTLENGALASVFSGSGLGNLGFGTGPAKDWMYTAPAVSFARDSNAATTEGYYAVTA